MRDAPYWHLGDDTVYFVGATTVYVAPSVSITDLLFTRDGDDLVITAPDGGPVVVEDVFTLGSDELPAVAVEEGLISIDRVLEIMRNTVESSIRVEAIQFTSNGVELSLNDLRADGLIGTVVGVAVGSLVGAPLGSLVGSFAALVAGHLPHSRFIWRDGKNSHTSSHCSF